jgi:hypothetical protein
MACHSSFVDKAVSDAGHVWNDTRRDFGIDGHIEFVDVSTQVNCCDLVRRGADRVRVAELVTEYLNLGPAEDQTISRVEFVSARLAQEADAAAV